MRHVNIWFRLAAVLISFSSFAISGLAQSDTVRNDVARCLRAPTLSGSKQYPTN